MIDREYVRSVGEEVRAALFPRQREDGRQPYPTPVRLLYRMPDGTQEDVKFVMVRTYQPIGYTAPDVKASLIDVTFGTDWIGEIDLRFGREFEDDEYRVYHEPRSELDEPLMALLRAITGTL